MDNVLAKSFHKDFRESRQVVTYVFPCRESTMIGLLLSTCLFHSQSGPTDSRLGGACVAICNHWSYTGIGWQLGLESDALSIMDALELYDRAGVKTCIDMDTRAYERMAVAYPELMTRLGHYLRAGHVEVTGGTYGQPMGTMFSGESDIRQIVYGVQSIERTFRYRPTTFLNEEEFTFPQLPQILKSAGFKYASLAQVDTWGKAGCPNMENDVFNWEGKDGTIVPSTPENSLYRPGFDPNGELQNWARTASSPSFKALASQGKPMFIGWEEFGWENPETPAYSTDAAAFKSLAEKAPIEYVTLTDYMNKCVAQPKATIKLNMDDWNKSLTWGLGGDQLRCYNNRVEAQLNAAERFDAVASTIGFPSQSSSLEAVWKDFLAAQSHDAGLCEYSRWQGDRMAALDRLEDNHNLTWGALGYNLLDSAKNRGEAALAAALRFIVSKTDSHAPKGASRVCTLLTRASGLEPTSPSPEKYMIFRLIRGTSWFAIATARSFRANC